MMKDKFGNYVVQKLMDIAEGEQKQELISRLKEFMPVLDKLPYGKHILFALREGGYGDDDSDDEGSDAEGGDPEDGSPERLDGAMLAGDVGAMQPGM